MFSRITAAAVAALERIVCGISHARAGLAAHRIPGPVLDGLACAPTRCRRPSRFPRTAMPAASKVPATTGSIAEHDAGIGVRRSRRIRASRTAAGRSSGARSRIPAYGTPAAVGGDRGVPLAGDAANHHTAAGDSQSPTHARHCLREARATDRNRYRARRPRADARFFPNNHRDRFDNGARLSAKSAARLGASGTTTGTTGRHDDRRYDHRYHDHRRRRGRPVATSTVTNGLNGDAEPTDLRWWSKSPRRFAARAKATQSSAAIATYQRELQTVAYNVRPPLTIQRALRAARRRKSMSTKRSSSIKCNENLVAAQISSRHGGENRPAIPHELPTAQARVAVVKAIRRAERVALKRPSPTRWASMPNAYRAAERRHQRRSARPRAARSQVTPAFPTPSYSSDRHASVRAAPRLSSRSNSRRVAAYQANSVRAAEA